MYNLRLEKLRKEMSALHLDAMLVSGSANVRYLSGFSGSESDLVVTSDTVYLLCDARYTLQASIECLHCKVLDTAGGIYNLLNSIIADHNIRFLGIEDRSLSLAAFNAMSKTVAGAALIPAGAVVTNLRILKDEKEITALKKAAWIADRAFDHVLPLIKTGVKEIEIAAEIEYSMRKNGAENIAFDTIVASGPNAAKPHGTASEKPIQPGDFVVMDYGCIVDGYCSDITRTVAVGPITEAQKSVYNSVLFVQTKMLSLIHSGMACSEADAIARRHFSLFGCEKYFTHSLGHGVGIDIHEQPNLSGRSDKIISDNMVITVEPGLYLDGKYGVRIEDTVVISGGKPYRLTNSPKELIII
ncbi:MAG: aminopeptidase P family protein [Clostridia bacterium]|nr:aminopeptidase P family protein [Clostridia bacterium]